VTETLERLHGMHFATRRQAKDEVIDWLQFSNHRRLHSTLGYLSPMAFEKKRLAVKERLGRIFAHLRGTLNAGKFTTTITKKFLPYWREITIILSL
jgi:hypothetical protein